VIVVGVLLRVRRFLAPQGLLHDEVLLALNLRERGLWELLLPLGYEQAAPVGFLWLTRIACAIGGFHEYVLRIVPLLASVAILVVAWVGLRKRLDSLVMLGLLVLLSLSEYLIGYGVQIKQYTFEALCALIILVATLKFADKPFSYRRVSLFAGFGAVIVWFAHTSVFVLAGVGTYLIVAAIGRRRFAEGLAYVGMSGMWLASFGVNYFAISRHYSRSDYLTSYWESGFPRSVADFGWFVATFRGVVDSPLALKFASLVGVLMVIGVFNLWMRARRMLWLAFFPIVFTLLAAVFQKYPFQERLVIFLVPAMLLLVASSLIPAKAGAMWGVVVKVLFLAVLVYPFYLSAKYTVRVPVIYDVRPPLEFVARHYEAGDTVYLHWGADVVGSYYLLSCDEPILRDVEVVRGKVVHSEQEYGDDLRQFAQRGRVWVVLAMGKREEQQKVLEGVAESGGERVLSYDDGGGAAFLCSFGDVRPVER